MAEGRDDDCPAAPAGPAGLNTNPSANAPVVIDDERMIKSLAGIPLSSPLENDSGAKKFNVYLVVIVTIVSALCLIGEGMLMSTATWYVTADGSLWRMKNVLINGTVYAYSVVLEVTNSTIPGSETLVSIHNFIDWCQLACFLSCILLVVFEGIGILDLSGNAKKRWRRRWSRKFGKYMAAPVFAHVIASLTTSGYFIARLISDDGGYGGAVWGRLLLPCVPIAAIGLGLSIEASYLPGRARAIEEMQKSQKLSLKRQVSEEQQKQITAILQAGSGVDPEAIRRIQSMQQQISGGSGGGSPLLLGRDPSAVVPSPAAVAALAPAGVPVLPPMAAHVPPTPPPGPPPVSVPLLKAQMSKTKAAASATRQATPSPKTPAAPPQSQLVLRKVESSVAVFQIDDETPITVTTTPLD